MATGPAAAKPTKALPSPVIQPQRPSLSSEPSGAWRIAGQRWLLPLRLPELGQLVELGPSPGLSEKEGALDWRDCRWSPRR